MDKQRTANISLDSTVYAIHMLIQCVSSSLYVRMQVYGGAEGAQDPQTGSLQLDSRRSFRFYRL